MLPGSRHFTQRAVGFGRGDHALDFVAQMLVIGKKHRHRYIAVMIAERLKRFIGDRLPRFITELSMQIVDLRKAVAAIDSFVMVGENFVGILQFL